MMMMALATMWRMRPQKLQQLPLAPPTVLLLMLLATTTSSLADSAAAAHDDQRISPSMRIRIGAPELVGSSGATKLPHYWFPNNGVVLGKRLLLPVRTTCDTPCFNKSDSTVDVLTARTESHFSVLRPSQAPWDVVELVPSTRGPTVRWFSSQFTMSNVVTTVQPHRNRTTAQPSSIFSGHATRWEASNASTREPAGLKGTTVVSGVSYSTDVWTNVTSLDGCGQIARTADGSLLQSVNFNCVGQAGMGVAVFTSIQGLRWRWIGVAARPTDLPQPHLGASETALATLPDGSALIAIRTGNGFHARNPLFFTRSTSQPLGQSWSTPAPIVDTTGQQLWGVRPNLLPVTRGKTLLLSTGRPGLFLWASPDNGRSWTGINVAASHNVGVSHSHVSKQFSAACVNARLQGPDGAETTAYTSLVAGVGGADAVIVYDRLAHGWHGPSANESDAVYCMPIWVDRYNMSTSSPRRKTDDTVPPPLVIDATRCGRKFEGIGALMNSNAPWLTAYPPKQLAEILDILFLPRYAASMQVLKLEVGGDGHSTINTESSHMHTEHELPSFRRGWVLPLLREARRRNPELKVGGLAWTWPSWTKGSVEKKVKYLTAWAIGLRSEYNVVIDFIGLQNEAEVTGGPANFSVALRRSLDAAGFHSTLIDCCDAHDWHDLQPLFDNHGGAFFNAVDALAVHEPLRSTEFVPSAAQATGKRIWSSESWQSYANSDGGGCWARCGACRMPHFA
jgi:hypothetical protein